MTTLAGLVTKYGSQESAARECGVVLSTFSRWITRKSRPRGNLVIKRLDELGVRRDRRGDFV